MVDVKSSALAVKENFEEVLSANAFDEQRLGNVTMWYACNKILNEWMIDNLHTKSSLIR